MIFTLLVESESWDTKSVVLVDFFPNVFTPTGPTGPTGPAGSSDSFKMFNNFFFQKMITFHWI
jgi:hypothetical protein